MLSLLLLPMTIRQRLLKHNFIQLKAAISGGVTISDCTFYNNVAGSKYFMDSNKLSTNLTIIRTVLGMSMDAAARGPEAGESV